MKLVEWFEGVFTGLGETIKSPFVGIADFLEVRLQNKITGSIEQVFEDFEHELKMPLKPVFESALQNPNLPPDLRAIIEEANEPQHFASAAILAGAAAISIMPVLSAATSAGVEQVRQGSMSVFKPTLLGVDEALGALWRGEWDNERFSHEMKQHGFNEDRQEIIKEVRRYVPNANDLIRFTVRDVFRESVVQDYQYDTGFYEMVKNLKPWMDKIGMDQDVMRLFWRAHWALPSIGQAFEMLHRGQINEGQIRDLLRINDVAPTWIDPIINVAYKPYTRVDVRRMYVAGVLDKSAVMQSYTDLGYDFEHATNMTDWTIADSMQSEKDLTKSETMAAYAQGALTVEDASANLTDLGYDGEESKLILSIQDYKDEKKLTDKEKRIAANYFSRGQITIDELTKVLQGLGLSEREINISVEDARSKVREKTALPSKADLAKWLEKGILSDDQYRAEMRLKGFSPVHIENYLNARG